MEEDVYPFIRRQTRRSVALLVQSVGFEKINQMPLDVLADIMERYIDLIGSRIMKFAEHAQHHTADAYDMLAAMEDLGMPPESLRNLIQFTEPIKAPEVPRLPESDSKILGLNHNREIDEQTPGWCYPWMPSISQAKKIDADARSAKEKKIKEAAENSEDENMQSEEENPPSAPGGARGPDHQYPQQLSPSDCPSYPATPMTPLVMPGSVKKPTPLHSQTPKQSPYIHAHLSNLPLGADVSNPVTPIKTTTTSLPNTNAPLNYTSPPPSVSKQASTMNTLLGLGDSSDESFVGLPQKGSDLDNDEPPGISDSSEDELPPAAKPLAFDPIPPERTPILSAVPSMTGIGASSIPPTPVGAAEPTLDSEKEKQIRDEAKRIRKLKKRAEKEKRREEKRKKKEAKKKRKQEEGQNSEAPNASEPDSLDGSGKRRPGRPPKKDKEPKIPKPRGRPPKDPLKRLEKERQLQQAIEQHKSSQSGGSANSSFNSTMSSGMSGLESAEKKKTVQTSLPTPVVKKPPPKPVSSLDCLDLSSDSDSEIIPPAPKPIIAPVQMTTPKVTIPIPKQKTKELKQKEQPKVEAKKTEDSEKDRKAEKIKDKSEKVRVPKPDKTPKSEKPVKLEKTPKIEKPAKPEPKESKPVMEEKPLMVKLKLNGSSIGLKRKKEDKEERDAKKPKLKKDKEKRHDKIITPKIKPPPSVVHEKIKKEKAKEKKKDKEREEKTGLIEQVEFALIVYFDNC